MYFHYTSIDAFFNIIENNNVWFGSLAFMNDEMEGFDLHSVLREVLQLKHGDENCQNTFELIDTLIETYLRFQMAFSASTLEDDISQWRAYTKLGHGICIEFEDGFILDTKAKKHKCIYDFGAKKKAIISNKYLKANDVTVNNIIQTQVGLNEYVASIIGTLARFKNSSFKPEKEVRWVYNLKGLTDPDARLEFRPHRLGLTPYQKVGIDTSKVLSVTIGPQVPVQNKRSIEDYLIVRGCQAIVKKSKVTLR